MDERCAPRLALPCGGPCRYFSTSGRRRPLTLEPPPAMTTPVSETDAEDLERLRYPVGRLERRSALTPSERASMIETIAAFPARLRAAADSLDDAGLDTPYRPGGWTKRQVIHHVVDSHVNAYCRFQFAMAEDEPAIVAYDEKAWAEL